MELVNKKNFIEKEELIKKAIIRVIAFFDLLDYALTVQEIYDLIWLENFTDRLDFVDVNNLLLEMTGKYLDVKDNFYFFIGREELVKKRIESVSLIEKKYKVGLKAIGYLKFVPGVKMVAVCNSLAMGNVNQESDIDLFIITSVNRIWATRLLVTLIVQFLGVRRRRQSISDRVCLSFYISEKQMNLQAITLSPDPYFNYWLATLNPVYGKHAFINFCQENFWLKNYLPNSLKTASDFKRIVNDNKFSTIFKNINGLWFESIVGNQLERFVKYLQLKKMSKNVNSLAKENDSRVIISDLMLKFHETDRRQELKDRWENKVKQINEKI